MAAAFLIALQAAASPAPVPAPIPLDFDLARVARGLDCGVQTASLIVVCGRLPPRDAYPMGEMARRYARGPLRAEFGVGGGTGRAFAEQVDFGQGRISNRAMIGIRLPF